MIWECLWLNQTGDKTTATGGDVHRDRTFGPIYRLGQFITKTYMSGQDIYQDQVAITVTDH